MNNVTVSNHRPDTALATNNWQGNARQQALATGISASAKAEIESMLMMADARPRNEQQAIQKMMVSCDRPRLAELASYEYAKGGTSIFGASIRLLEMVAQKWGNMKWGFHELSRENGESTVMCYAIDLESNARVERMIVVSHEIGTRNGTKKLTDEREIYEWIANKAQRRVRTCLENIIPRDVIEECLDACNRTAKSNVEITPDILKRTLATFAEHGVTKEHIEKLLQRKFDIDTVTPGNILRLRRIYQSITDGMSEASDNFDMEVAKKPDVVAAVAEKPRKSRKKVEPKPKAEPKVEKSEPNPMDIPSRKAEPETEVGPPPEQKIEKRAWDSMLFATLLDQCNTDEEVASLVISFDTKDLSEDASNWMMSEIADRKNTIFEQNNNG